MSDSTAHDFAQLRERAERALDRHSWPSPRGLNKEDLLHELQVQHVELTMQHEELRRAQLHLEQSQDAYRALFDRAPVGSFTCAPSGKILAANARLAEILETHLSDLVGSAFPRFAAPSHRDAFHHHVVALRDGATVATSEMAIVTAAGRRRIIRLDGRALTVAGGAQGRLLMSVVDVTKDDDDEPASAIHRGGPLGFVGQLAAGMAHAFNNHLSAVIGNLDLAIADARAGDGAGDGAGGGAHPEDGAELLAEAQAGARRAMALANRLATLAAGGAPVKTAIRLDELLRQGARSALSVPGVEVDLAPPPELWDIAGDDRQLLQAFEELVANACDAMPDGGVLRITASNVPAAGGGTSPGPHVRVDVVDEGPGIAASSRARIFEPFFTTKQDRMGLGLAIVASVAHRHGGAVEVRPRAGGGTTFSFSLPARRTAAAGRGAAAHGSDDGGLRVLVMDDEPAILRLSRRILSGAGHEADIAADGQEAIAAYREATQIGRPYDLVILDLNVAGGMGGVETLAALRAIDPGVRAIVCSGYCDEPVMAEPDRFGFAAVIQKPFRGSELLAAVAELAGASDSATGPS